MRFSLIPTENSARKKLFLSAFFLVLCFAAYGNSLHNGFLMDDFPMLLENRQLGSLSFLQLDFHPHTGEKYFRPVVHVLNLITYNFFGRNPTDYHLLSLLLFYLACITLYEVLDLLIKNKGVVFLTVMLFCLHPINGMLVNYKNATGYPFLVLAVNLSIFSFLKIETAQNKILHQGLSLLWFVLALLCHELVVAFPLYLGALLWLLKGRRPAQALRQLIPYLIVLAGYFIFRMHFFSLKGPLIDSIRAMPIPFFSFTATYARLIFWYIGRLLFLNDIVLMMSMPVVTGLKMILFLTVVLVAAGTAILYYICRKPKPNPTAFAFSWIIIGFLPVGLACFSRREFGIIIEPHWLIFASIGYFLLLSILLSRLRQHIRKPLWYGLIIAITLFYITGTWHYNYLWGNQKRYCRYWISVSPDEFWPNFWLGYAYSQEQNYAAAREPFTRIARVHSPDYAVLANLGVVEYNLGHLDLSREYFIKSLRLNPRVADTYYFIGDIHLTRGDLDKAEKFFLEAIRLDPYLLDSIKKLAVVYREEGRPDKSVLLYKVLMKIKANDRTFLEDLQQLK